MKKRRLLSFISALTLSLTSLSFAPAYAVAEEKAAASASSTSDNKFDAEKFYVVVGTYENKYTQLKYVYPKSNTEYTGDKVVWENAPADLSYGDVLVSDGNEKKTLVYSAPDNPVYAMASYYKLDDSAVLNKVGNCADLMDSKELTVTSAMYDGSGHWSIHLNDADGQEYYYGYNFYASTLGVDLGSSKTGDKYQFAFNDGKLVVPLSKKNDAEASASENDKTQSKSYWIFYKDIDTKEIDETVAEKVHDYTYSLYEQGLGGTEVEKKVADYSQEIRLGLLKEAYKEASAKIVKELGIEDTEVFCSNYTATIVCKLTDEQYAKAQKSENIEQITMFNDFTLEPQTELTDKNSIIEFFTTDSEGKPLLGDDVKIDAVLNSGKNKDTDYLIIYGLSDKKEISPIVKKLNTDSRFSWGTPIDIFSGGIFYTTTTKLPVKNNVQLILFVNDTLPGFTGYDIARYSEEVGFDARPYIISRGDTNGDCSIDAVDASNILSAYAKLQTSNDYSLTADEIKKMDVDGNDKVDAVDASLVLSYYTDIATGGSSMLKDFVEEHYFTFG